MSIRRKVMIITGANSGIGLECFKKFADIYTVIGISRNINNLIDMSLANTKIYQCDVSDFAALKKVIEDIINSYTNIDILINNAGDVEFVDLSIKSHESNASMISTNIVGFTNILELVVPYLLAKQSGDVINISSLSDRNPRPMKPVYAASKAYVRSISESLRKQCAKHNIRITNIAPANIDTPMLEKSAQTQHMISKQDFVNILKFIIELPSSICIRDLVIAPTGYEN